MLFPFMHPRHQVAPAQLPRGVLLQSVDEVEVNQSERPRLMVVFNKAGS